MVVAMITVRTIALALRAKQVGAPVEFSRVRSKGGRRSGGLVSRMQGVVR
jgi:hypothetical protein